MRFLQDLLYFRVEFGSVSTSDLPHGGTANNWWPGGDSRPGGVPDLQPAPQPQQAAFVDQVVEPGQETIIPDLGAARDPYYFPPDLVQFLNRKLEKRF